MQKNIGILAFLGAILVGFVLGYFVKDSEHSEIVVERNTEQHTMGDAMEEASHSLHGKTGDEFDQSFLLDMIDHHNGAIHMAEHALESTNRQEIKDLANSILKTQSKESIIMQIWLKEWFGK